MFWSLESRKFANLCAFTYSSIIFALVIGQTPPNYNPSTLNSLNVTFNGNQRIYPGQALQPDEASYTPRLSSRYLNMFDSYIAFMMDIEIVNSGVAYPLLHWYQPDMLADYPEGDEFVLKNFTNSGAPYVGPQPNPGPSHSYVVLLYRQPLNYKFPQCFDTIFPISVETRGGFDLPAFTEMVGLGEPLGANWFTSQNRESRVTLTSLSKASCATWASNSRLEDLQKDDL